MSDTTLTLTGAELLGLAVSDAADVPLGLVRDVRFERDTDGDLVATGLVVGRRMLSERLGYASGVVDGPALLTWWFRRRQSHLRWVPWEHVASLDHDGVVLAVTGDRLDPVREVHS